MSIRIRRRISPWGIFLVLAGLLVAVALVFSLNKPLPTYMVAKREIAVGEKILQSDFELVPLDLGPLASKYLAEVPEDLQAISQIPAGELVPISRLGSQLLENQTSVRVIPSIQPSANVKAGSLVSIWQVIEIEDEFLPQLLVERAEVSTVEFGEGLFADELPQVELLLSSEQAKLLITALAADYEVFVLPVS